MSRRRGSLIVFSAPSGTGKSTIVRRLLDEIEGLSFSVSATTREPRDGERDGVDYHFLARPAFEELVGAGGFLEHAEVHGNLYGTPRDTTESALEAGTDLLLDIDVQGARQVAESGFPAHSVFVLPPSQEELERRLRSRGTETEAALRERLKNAAAELALASRFDHVVVNDDLELAVASASAIVWAVRTSRFAMAPVVQSVLESFGGAAGAGS